MKPAPLSHTASVTACVYGNTAVASFVGIATVFPPGERAVNLNRTWFTLVLVKEGREWGIAHTHASPAGNPGN